MGTEMNQYNDDSYTLANFKTSKTIKAMKAARKKRQQKLHQQKCQQLLDNCTPNYVLGYN